MFQRCMRPARPPFLIVARRIKILRRVQPIATLKAIGRAWAASLRQIENALHTAEQEQSGLNERVEDVLARAAVTLGNGTDEYLERDARDSHHQDLFSAEISNGQRRLKELATAIPHFKFLKTATLSRFPDFKPPRTE